MQITVITLTFEFKQQDPAISRVIRLAELLETCQFLEAWVRVFCNNRINGINKQSNSICLSR